MKNNKKIKLIHTTDCNKIKVELGENGIYIVDCLNKKFFGFAKNKMSAFFFAEGLSAGLIFAEDKRKGKI